MRFARNGVLPRVHADSNIAATASIIGNVVIGAGAYVDHNVVIASSGLSIEIGEGAIILAGSVIRSVGGSSRPGFAAAVGPGTLVAPHCVLTGCRIGANCYIATAAIVLQGAEVGDDSRIGVGALVHAGAKLPAGARIGFRHIAVPAAEGFISTSDVEEARNQLSSTHFFDLAFGEDQADQAVLHRAVIARLCEEVHGWIDEPC